MRGRVSTANCCPVVAPTQIISSISRDRRGKFEPLKKKKKRKKEKNAQRKGAVEGGGRGGVKSAPIFTAWFEPLARVSDSLPRGRRSFRVCFGAASTTMPFRTHTAKQQQNKNKTKTAQKRSTPQRNRGIPRANDLEPPRDKAQKGTLLRKGCGRMGVPFFFFFFLSLSF